jgi:hypothetical protein
MRQVNLKHPQRAVRAGLLAIVFTVAAVFALPTPGMAANYLYECEYSWASCQEGVLVSAPSGLPCGTTSTIFHSTTVCIGYDGDYVYVRDGEADGDSAIASIQNSSDGSSVTYRSCRNKEGVGTWVRCNFNWSESGTKYVSGGVRHGYYDVATDFLWEFSGK